MGSQLREIGSVPSTKLNATGVGSGAGSGVGVGDAVGSDVGVGSGVGDGVGSGEDSREASEGATVTFSRVISFVGSGVAVLRVYIALTRWFTAALRRLSLRQTTKYTTHAKTMSNSSAIAQISCFLPFFCLRVFMSLL